MARIHGALDINLSIQVNTTVSRHTIKDLPRVFDLLAGIQGIVLWDLFFLVPTGRARREDGISPEQHEGVFRWLYGLGHGAPFGIKTTLGQHYRRVILQSALSNEKGLPLKG